MANPGSEQSYRRPRENFSRDDENYGAPVLTEQGVRCGNHGHGHSYHETAAAVRACYQLSREQADQAAGECWAENAWLRAAENHPEDAESCYPRNL